MIPPTKIAKILQESQTQRQSATKKNSPFVAHEFNEASQAAAAAYHSSTPSTAQESAPFSSPPPHQILQHSSFIIKRSHKGLLLRRLLSRRDNPLPLLPQEIPPRRTNSSLLPFAALRDTVYPCSTKFPISCEARRTRIMCEGVRRRCSDDPGCEKLWSLRFGNRVEQEVTLS